MLSHEATWLISGRMLVVKGGGEALQGMAQIEFVGVDGCRAGWFSVGFDRCGGYEVAVFTSFSQLLTHYGDARRVFADIPIGLPQGPERRDCDGEARKLLGRRRSSVFSAPTRQTVEQAAASPGDYRGALEIERRFAGRGISRQAFAIAPKIAEVDRVMLYRDVSATPQVREVHPELCFWSLNNRQPMEFGKKKSEGESERLRLLQGIEPRSQEIYEGACSKFLRKVVARDDILDALVAAIIATRGEDQLKTVPENPPRDARGLPMEMVF